MTWARTLWWTVVLALAAPAAVLTGLRLSQDLGSGVNTGWAIRAVSFTPLAVVPYVLVLILLVTAAFRAGPGIGPTSLLRYAGIAVTVVALALHSWWFAPALIGGQPDRAEGSQSLRVLSLNLLGGEADAQQVIRMARRDEVDVLVLTEATPQAVSALTKAGLERRWPHRAGAAAGGAAGTIVASRYPVTDEQELPTRFGTWRMTLAAPDGDLSLIAAHPTPPTRRGDWADDLSVLVAAAHDGPDLIVGDLNATPDHRPIRLLADAGLRSASERANAGWAPTWPANGRFFGLPPLVQIDHVLTGPSLTVLEVETHQVSGTDHLAVRATLAEATRDDD